MGNVVVVEKRTIIWSVLRHIICNVCLCVLCNYMWSFLHILLPYSKLWRHINHHCCWWHWCCSRGVKSVDFHPMSVVLVLNCKLLGGCLGSESRSDLSSASKARADGAVCFNRGTNRFHSQLWEIEVLHGVTQDNKACLTGGPVWEAGGQSKANVLHQDHSIVVCFSHVLLCGKGLDLTLTISLAFHITSHWAVLVSVRQYAVLLLNMQVKLIHIATIYHFSLVQSESKFQKTQKDKLSIVFLRTEKTSSITVNSSPRLQRGWIKFRTRW